MSDSEFVALIQRRNQLQENIDLLVAASLQWRGLDRERGARTIENLTQQLEEVETALWADKP